MRSLRAKLALGFGGLLAILLAVSLLSIVVLTRYSHTLERAFRDYLGIEHTIWLNRG